MVLALPGPVQFVVALTVAEIAAYWAHRATHQVPLLWRFHKVHHASAQLDWLAAAHLHPVDQIFVRTAAVVPLFVLGFSRDDVRRLPGVRGVPGDLRSRERALALRSAALDRRHAGVPPLAPRERAASTSTGTSSGLPDDRRAVRHVVPAARWPSAYGVSEPQPESYLAQLRWSFR